METLVYFFEISYTYFNRNKHFLPPQTFFTLYRTFFKCHEHFLKCGNITIKGHIHFCNGTFFFTLSPPLFLQCTHILKFHKHCSSDPHFQTRNLVVEHKEHEQGRERSGSKRCRNGNMKKINCNAPLLLEGRNGLMFLMPPIPMDLRFSFLLLFARIIYLVKINPPYKRNKQNKQSYMDVVRGLNSERQGGKF